MNTLHNLIASRPEKAILEHQHITLITGQNCTYFNVSQPETSIREHQQIDPLSGWFCYYLNVSILENVIPYNQQIDDLSVRHNPYLIAL